MFKNRSFQIKVVRDEDLLGQQRAVPSNQVPLEEFERVASRMLDEMMVRGALMVSGYLLLDTVRKVIVAKAS